MWESLFHCKNDSNIQHTTNLNRCLRFSSDADIVRLTNARIIIIIIIIITSCAGGCHNMPGPLQVELWPFDLESDRITWDVGYLCDRPVYSRLRPDVRDSGFRLHEYSNIYNLTNSQFSNFLDCAESRLLSNLKHKCFWHDLNDLRIIVLNNFMINLYTTKSAVGLLQRASL